MTRARTWLLLGPAMALAGVLLVTTFAPRARAATDLGDDYETPRTHQLVVCLDMDCKPRGRPMNATACALDLASLANTLPKGAKLTCQRVTR